MGGYSWVTLATNDSYSLGALVLAHSLKQVGTKQQLAVLITPGVTQAMRSKLSEVFNVVQEVNILDSKDEANLRLLKRPELGVTFTKLHCWRLTQFDKCVFLDADTLVLENCDELFDREELSAAPDIGWPDCFNSGVFVYRPSNETYEKLVQFALEKGSFDGGDQGLLNLYFSDWSYKDISKHLPFIYNMASTACYSYLPAFKQFGGNAKIIHFIGTSKPWLQYFDTETKQVHPSQGYEHLRAILQHWWNLFCSLIHPHLSPDMAGIAGAFAKLTLGQPRTAEQLALDDHLRRQGWEVGNIDYLGRDSFDNIWNKICETLSSSPAPVAPKPKVKSEPVTQTQVIQSPPDDLKSVETEKPVEVPKELAAAQTLTEQISASSQELQKPSPETPVTIPTPMEPEIPKPVAESPQQTADVPKPATQTPEPAAEPTKPIEEPSKPTTEIPEPALVCSKPVAESPTQVAELAKLDTPKSVVETPQPVGETPKSVAENPKPVAETPKPVEECPKPVAEIPKPVEECPKPVAEIPKPVTEPPKPSTETPKSVAETPKPVAEAPKPVEETPKPVAETPKPVAEAPKPPTEIPKPVAEAPKPVTEVSKPVPESPKPPTESPKQVSDPPKEVTESTKVDTKSSQQLAEPPKPEPAKLTTESQKIAQEPEKSSTVAAAPVCPIKSKPEESKETKSGSKKGKEAPKTEVTATSPPTSPLSPQPKQNKQALSVDTAIPDTPPPATQESSSGPTPPPRKGSSGAKKSATKTKK